MARRSESRSNRSSRRNDDGPTRVSQIVGVVGGDPEEKDTSAGVVVNFSVATTLSYGDRDDPDDRGETRWYNVAVWKEALQDWVLDNIHRGSRVAIEGAASKDQWEGRDQYKMSAFRIGHVEWAVMSASRSTSSADDGDDDDL